MLSNVSNNTVHNAGLLASRYPDHGKGEAEAREPRIVTGHKVYQVNIIYIIDHVNIPQFFRHNLAIQSRMLLSNAHHVPGGGGRPGDAAVRGQAPGQHGPHVETGGQGKETVS